MVELTTKITLEIIKLYRTDYRLQYHVREIAKLIGKNHTTILPYLNELKKKNILTVKNIGRNKVYSLNLNSIIAREYLSMAEIQHSVEYLKSTLLIRKITEEMFKLNLDGTIILFGSYAKHRQTSKSDIDLFYLGKISQPDSEKIKSIGKIYGKTINMKTSDIGVFENAVRKKDPLVKEIIKNHILLQNQHQFISILWRYYNEIL